ncbi:MAG TPA: hypothetical protein VJT71_08090 [Pyrinomonadaceae bacterium]|nr:hypothetical protein [Pyrinomonadaceae bacterium]
MRKFFLACCIFLLASAVTFAQRGNRPDSATLRSKFISAVGGHFELIKDEIKSQPVERGGGTYWLAYANPKGPGHFALQYRFKDNDGFNSHSEREISFGVGAQGCRRGPPDAGVYSRFCVGDTIIIPFLWQPSTEHEFKLKAILPAEGEDTRTFEEKYPETRDQGLDKTPVDNPAESLKYVGRRAHKMLHRIPGYTLNLIADFEAVKPGKFNLVVSSASPAVALGKTPEGSVPIIIVARGTPVTLIAGSEQERHFTMGANGEYLSSTSGNNYMTNLIVLQPGDRISLSYFGAKRGPEYERSGYARSGGVDPAESLKPVISVHPFALDKTWEFSEWLVDHLP